MPLQSPQNMRTVRNTYLAILRGMSCQSEMAGTLLGQVPIFQAGLPQIEMVVVRDGGHKRGRGKLRPSVLSNKICVSESSSNQSTSAALCLLKMDMPNTKLESLLQHFALMYTQACPKTHLHPARASKQATIYIADSTPLQSTCAKSFPAQFGNRDSLIHAHAGIWCAIAQPLPCARIAWLDLGQIGAVPKQIPGALQHMPKKGAAGVLELLGIMHAMHKVVERRLCIC